MSWSNVSFLFDIIYFKSYDFPLNSNEAALTGLVIDVDGKIIRAEIKEKQKATNTYVIWFHFTSKQLRMMPLLQDMVLSNL